MAAKLKNTIQRRPEDWFPPVRAPGSASSAESVADGDYGDISITAGVWSIDPGTVSLAKMANMATGSLFYRKTAGVGAPEVQSLATLKTDLLLTGTNSGDQFTNTTTARFLGRITAGFGAAEEITAAQAKTLLAIAAADVSGLGYFATGTDAANLTGTISASRFPGLAGGDVTSSVGSGVLTIGANKVTRAMLAAAASATILGATAAGNVADLTPAQAKTVLAIAAADVSGLGVFATGTDAANLTGTVSTAQLPALTGGDVTSSAGSGTLVIGAGKVTLAMQANMATASVVYRKTAGAGAPEVQTLATLKTDLELTGTNSGDQTTISGNAGSATVLQTSRNFSIAGGGITAAAVGFDGSAAVALSASVDAGHITLARMANLAANSFIGNNTGLSATPIAMTVAQAKTLLAIAESDVANLTTDLAAKAPLANPEFTGVAFYQQPSPTARNSTTTLTIADLLTLIITSTSATAVSLTLPTGTLTDAGILSGALPNNEGFEWVLINLGSSSGAVTLVAGTNHTIVGQAVTPIGSATASGVSRWFTRKTATNTFITYRIG